MAEGGAIKLLAPTVYGSDRRAGTTVSNEIDSEIFRNKSKVDWLGERWPSLRNRCERNPSDLLDLQVKAVHCTLASFPFVREMIRIDLATFCSEATDAAAAPSSALRRVASRGNMMIRCDELFIRSSQKRSQLTRMFHLFWTLRGFVNYRGDGFAIPAKTCEVVRPVDRAHWKALPSSEKLQCDPVRHDSMLLESFFFLSSTRCHPTTFLAT